MEPEIFKLLSTGSLTPLAVYGVVLLSKIARRMAAVELKLNIIYQVAIQTLPADKRAELLERNMMRPGETDTILKDVFKK